MIRGAPYAETIQSLLSYAQAFREKYDVRIFDMSMSNIVEDIMSSHFLAASPREMRIRYIADGVVMCEHVGVLLLFEKLRKETPVVSTFGIA